MFSKTGNTVDSTVNQMLHQGVEPTGGVKNALLTSLEGQNLQPGMGQHGVGHHGLGHHGMGQPGMGQPGMGQPGMGQPGMGQPGMGQPGMGQQGFGQPGMVNSGMGQPGMGQPGFGQPGMVNSGMGQSVDQTFGHQSLGTVQGMVGQGVSTGLGYHTMTPLPSRDIDPQYKDTRHHGALGGAAAGGALGTGKGTITFRPIEARFNHDKDLLGKMDPYCKFKIGFHTGKSAVAKGQGVSPVWQDAVIVKHKNQEFAKLKVKDQDKLKIDGTIGIAKIPLDQVISRGTLDQWIPISKKEQVTGEVHLIMEYMPTASKKAGNVNHNNL